MLTNDPKIIAEVKTFFEEFVAAYPKDDLDRYLNLLSSKLLGQCTQLCSFF